jgi:two-component system sensor histidine kinase SenX3
MSMDSVWLVPLSLVFGVVVGAGVTLLLSAAARRGRRAAAAAEQTVPDGVAQVIEAMGSPAIVVDPSNNALVASPVALTLGLVSNQTLVHPEIVALVAESRRGAQLEARELELARGPFGEASIHLLVRVSLIGARYTLVLAEDRTESRRIEQVRRDFVANISHELKTPIGAVGLLAEALVEARKDAAQVKKFAKRLTKESERLARITQEIIDLSRLQAEDALTKAERVEIDEVVTQAIDQNRVAADRGGIQLARGKRTGAVVLGDEALLQVALHNLIANAVQYSPSGSRVGIGVTARDGVVEVAVSDQGIGIADEDRDRVFERFYRADASRSRNTGGSGLGLSIVKHVAQNHGGDVRVWTQPGKGSTFTLRLPAADSRGTAAS